MVVGEMLRVVVIHLAFTCEALTTVGFIDRGTAPLRHQPAVAIDVESLGRSLEQADIAEDDDLAWADVAQTPDDAVIAALARDLLTHHKIGKHAGSHSSDSSLRLKTETLELKEEVRDRTRMSRLCLFKQYVQDAATLGVRQRSMIQSVGSELPKVHGTCAVVGSSGTLLRHKHGKEIDKAAKVLRFNLAPIKGFGKHVGERTDIRLVNEKVLDIWNHEIQLRKLEKGGVTAASCTLCGLGTDDRVSADDFSRRSLDVLVAHPHVNLYASDLTLERATLDYLSQMYNFSVSGAGATTGAFGMAVALSICDEVKAYGMAATLHDDESPYHYWQPNSKPQGTAHHHSSFSAEKDLWLQFAVDPPEVVSETDVAIIPGFSQLDCP
jgi:hypothetical protein